MLKITANDIRFWTEKNNREAQGIVPELLRRLILCTTIPTNIDIPIGDGISVGGFDGEIELEEDIMFFKAGKTIIEIGVAEDIHQKAEDDYNKRALDSRGIVKADTNFVFVTSRLFSKSSAREISRNADNEWKSVVAINANKLELRLEQSPSVALRFGKIIGKSTEGLKDLMTARANVSQSTGVNVIPNLLINGRDEKVDELCRAAKISGNKISIQSESQIESYAFALASLIGCESLGAKVVTVQNQEHLNFLATKKSRLIIIPEKSFMPNIGPALGVGHTIIIPTGQSRNTTIKFNNSIELKPMARTDRIRGLKAMLGTDELASSVYGQTRGYFLPILRNKYLDPNNDFVPSRLGKVDVKILLTVLFLTEWEIGVDNELIEGLLRIPYETFEAELVRLSSYDDTPVRRGKLFNVWQVISKNDLWFFLKDSLDYSLLESFIFIAQVALTERNPALDLKKQDRWLAGIYGKKNKYSSRVTNGIVDTMALLGTLGDPKVDRMLCEISVEVFKDHRKVSDIIYSLGHNLCALAEATPEVFMDFVERNIDGFGESFQSGDALRDAQSYTNMLWALERLSWSPEYLGRASEILVNLAERYEKDIRDNYSNRPISSLMQIYLHRKPNTPGTGQDKLEILNMLAKNHGNVICGLLVRLCGSSSLSEIAYPIYQNWSKDANLMPAGKEVKEYIAGVRKLVLHLVKSDVENRIIKIFEVLRIFSKEELGELLDTLSETDFSSFQDQGTLLELQNEIEELFFMPIVHKNESVITTYPEFVDILKQIHQKATPQDMLIANKELFMDAKKTVFSLIDSYGGSDWNKQTEIANQERIRRIEEIYTIGGSESIKKLALILDDTSLLSQSLIGSTFKESFQESIFSLLEEKELNLRTLGMNFIGGLDMNGDVFVQSKIMALGDIDNDFLKGGLLFSLRFDNRVIEILKEQPERVQKVFRELHKTIRNYKLHNAEAYSDFQYVISELQKYCGPGYAFQVIEMLMHENKLNKVDVSMLFDVLRSMADSSDARRLIGDPEYYLEKLFKYFYDLIEEGKINREEILQLETMYIHIIKHPKIINDELSKNPQLYVELIKFSYKAEDEEKKAPSSQEQNRAKNAHEALSKFTKIPGLDNEGKIDIDVLKSWTEHVMELLKKNKRLKIGSQKIGELFSYSPQGEDGFWPSESVRLVVENLKSDDIETGLWVGKTNQRGLTSRGIYDGGKQERDISQGYSEAYEKMIYKFPRTAKLLKSISQEYKHFADRTDEEVEFDR